MGIVEIGSEESDKDFECGSSVGVVEEVDFVNDYCLYGFDPFYFVAEEAIEFF